jgi:hypothetical protein
LGQAICFGPLGVAGFVSGFLSVEEVEDKEGSLIPAFLVYSLVAMRYLLLDLPSEIHVPNFYVVSGILSCYALGNFEKSIGVLQSLSE